MLTYEKVGTKNLKEATKIQNLIFPKEKSNQAFKASIYPKLFPKHYKILKSANFWLVKKKNSYIGITGIYNYIKYPRDAWLDWFGIVQTEQKRGVGTQILEWTMQKAKAMGYENFRTYTSLEYNPKGIQFYRHKNFLEERYTAEKNISETILIFSKSLISKKVELWNNRMLNISFLEKY